jgi:hypothetical protein
MGRKEKEYDRDYEDAKTMKLVSVHATAVWGCMEAQLHSLNFALNGG